MLAALAAISLANCQAQFHSDFLEVADVANEQFLKRPVVRASGNIVNIADKSVANEYYGPLYVGSTMKSIKVSYDTMSDWTVVSSTAYDISSSITKSPWESPKGVPTTREFTIGD